MDLNPVEACLFHFYYYNFRFLLCNYLNYISPVRILSWLDFYPQVKWDNAPINSKLQHPPPSPGGAGGEFEVPAEYTCFVFLSRANGLEEKVKKVKFLKLGQWVESHSHKVILPFTEKLIIKSSTCVGHLNTFLAPWDGNLNKIIFNCLNA